MNPSTRHMDYWGDPDLVKRWAGLYADQITPGNVALMTRKVRTLEMLENETPGRLLDIGCGSGMIVAEAAQMGWDYLGVDMSEEMIREAQDHWKGTPKVQFKVGAIEQIPVENRSQKAITCLGVIEYLNDIPGAIREMRRVLEPGGFAIVSNHNKIHVDRVSIELLTPARAAIRPLTRLLWRTRGVDYPHPRTFLNPSALDEMMEREDFTLESFAFHHFTPLPFPFTVATPRLAHFVNYRFEKYAGTRPMGFFAHGYVGKYRLRS